MQGKKCNLYFLIFKCEQPTMVPDTSFTLNAFCICQRAHTRMGAETLPPVTHPGFTEITDCTLQSQQDITSGLLQYQKRDLSHNSQCILVCILSVGLFWLSERVLNQTCVLTKLLHSSCLFAIHFCRIKYDAK